MITHAKAVNRCLRRAPSPWFCLFSLLSAPGGPLLRAPADALVRPTDTSGLSIQRKAPSPVSKLPTAREPRPHGPLEDSCPPRRGSSARGRVGELKG